MKNFDKEFIVYQITFGYKKVEEFDFTPKQEEKIFDGLCAERKELSSICKGAEKIYAEQITNINNATSFLADCFNYRQARINSCR